MCLFVGCSETAPDATTQDTKQAAVRPISIARIRIQISRGDRDGAATMLKNYLLQNPQDPAAVELSGDLASSNSQTEQAIDQYTLAVELAETASEPLLNKLAMELMKANRAMESMEILVNRVEQYPDHLQARYDLVGLSAMLGFPELAVPSSRWLMQHGKSSAELLQVLADPQRTQADGDLCNKMLDRYPKDQRPLFGLAKMDASRLKWEQVTKKLSKLLESHPDFIPAHSLYGRALIELNRFEEIPEWYQATPRGAEQNPVHWLVAGAWAEHLGEYPQAAKCYWEGINLDDQGHPELLPALARALRQIQRPNEAKIVGEQIEKRAALRDALTTHFIRDASSQQAAMEVAKAMVSLGRTWEAEGWARLATTLTKYPLKDLREQYTSIRNQLATDTPWIDPKLAIANQLDLSDLPSLNWNRKGQLLGKNIPERVSNFRFKDEAGTRNWNHTCEVAPEASTEGHWIYQSMGGGVGVIDYDLDGWPDLAAAILNGTPKQTNSGSNRIFRNQSGEFKETSQATGYDDKGFGQGIAVGDFDNDGFPDLFDANIGHNRLYRNNGDGTFTEVSKQMGLSGNAWTTSATLADVDGDGIADLFETAYCGGDEPYQVPCRSRKDLYASCTPLKFPAELDRVWKGLSNGTFTEVTESWMTQETPGRGLGLQVGFLDDQEGLDIYVSNDMTVNHLWSGTGLGDNFQLTEVASVRGVAISGRSFSQASMGIAAGDPDADGDVDLFVTHFSDDHNTYYEQVGNGLWVDRSFPSGLGEASINLLGFGTEWIDFDNNSTQELVITNGHVDDVESEETTFYMPAQLFELNTDGIWKIVFNSTLGEYFEKDHLGRALVTLDADRDGRRDMAITHLFEPASLLMNHSTSTGRSISMRLVATESQRDAIGTRVSFSVDGKTVHHQLFAGDGYMCSNQRELHLGVADASVIEEMTVTWPSGKTETVGPIPTNAQIILIEGEGSPFIHTAH